MLQYISKNKKIWIKGLFSLVCIVMFFMSSCKKNSINTNSDIVFSTDTLMFDTLFATLGSTTKSFTIRNTQKKEIILNSIQLVGGVNSPYRMNVDGDVGTNFSNIKIPAKDSIYVFVEVTIDPNSAPLPFIVEDSILFALDGNTYQVQLNTYGKNAHFIYADSIENNTIWNDDLPYVIIDYLQIKPGASLTINAGCEVYFGNGAAMIVEGDLNIYGTDTSNMVLFRGVRLDKDVADRNYDDFPGQYAGLFFLRGSTGTIEYLNMRNSLYGINVGNIKATDEDAQNLILLQNMNLGNAPIVTIENSKIYNHAFYGLFGFFGRIYATNTLVYNCGKNVVGLYCGGDYEFLNCTFYARGTIYTSHAKDPVLYMNNFFDAVTPSILPDSTRAVFQNCILYGSLENEVIAQAATNNSHPIYLSIINSVVKSNLISSPTFTSCNFSDPAFVDVFKNNYKLKSNSPANNLGIIPFPPLDIDGFTRNSPPDVGAYEIQ
ncbi:MAG TPA: hypothetical protein PKZ14_01975 [Chitinophagales bacterium]|nr:hypothetical protein [Chitinophagales bacterium]